MESKEAALSGAEVVEESRSAVLRALAIASFRDGGHSASVQGTLGTFSLDWMKENRQPIVELITIDDHGEGGVRDAATIITPQTTKVSCNEWVDAACPVMRSDSKYQRR